VVPAATAALLAEAAVIQAAALGVVGATEEAVVVAPAEAAVALLAGIRPEAPRADAKS
jgi:hypothetical protein